MTQETVIKLEAFPVISSYTTSQNLVAQNNPINSSFGSHG